jgi:hypothetical protein
MVNLLISVQFVVSRLIRTDWQTAHLPVAVLDELGKP